MACSKGFGSLQNDCFAVILIVKNVNLSIPLMNEQRNFVVALAISFLILIGFNIFYDQPYAEKSKETKIQSSPTQSVTPKEYLVRSKALNQSPRLALESDYLRGSVNLRGGVIDDMELLQYRETTKEKSPFVKILSPLQTQNAYVVGFGWNGKNGPDQQTLWHFIEEGGKKKLTPLTPLHIGWTNSNGVRFERTFSIDEYYMITIKDRIKNESEQPVTFSAYGDIMRSGTPQTGGYFILHEGGIGVLANKVQSPEYKDILKEKDLRFTSTGGWLGFTDKNWLTAYIPDHNLVAESHFKYSENDSYHAYLQYPQKVIQPRESFEVQHRVFVGAKVLDILQQYEKEQNVDRFELAVDFGWFYFLTKPLFFLLETLHRVLGNFGLAIIALTIFVKTLTFPLAYKTFKSMQKIKLLQPKIMQLKTLYGEDKVKMNQELMKLYQKEKTNPMSGCLPVLIQGPIFFCLYKVFFVTIEMRHAPFFGWIKDLSEPDPLSLFNLFGLLPWSPPSFLVIGIWPILMGITMILQQKLNPQPIDPAQAKVMTVMPVLFTFLFASFPVGMVIYWTCSNIITILQQMIMKRLNQ
jgi:YidC/Oxa1 family membrane protein insertase